MSDDWEGINGSDASDYFFHEVVGTYTLDEDMRPSRIILANLFYLALAWLIVGVCIAFGIKWTGRIAYATMGLPIFMLAILLVRSLTLPGASKGIYEYIGKWDWRVLVEQPDIWSTAVTQIFFSIGVAVSMLRLIELFLRHHYCSNLFVPIIFLVWSDDRIWIALRKKCSCL